MKPIYQFKLIESLAEPCERSPMYQAAAEMQWTDKRQSLPFLVSKAKLQIVLPRAELQLYFMYTFRSVIPG